MGRTRARGAGGTRQQSETSSQLFDHWEKRVGGGNETIVSAVGYQVKGVYKIISISGLFSNPTFR